MRFDEYRYQLTGSQANVFKPKFFEFGLRERQPRCISCPQDVGSFYPSIPGVLILTPWLQSREARSTENGAGEARRRRMKKDIAQFPRLLASVGLEDVRFSPRGVRKVPAAKFGEVRPSYWLVARNAIDEPWRSSVVADTAPQG
jgi:hypothetical protein